MFEMGMREEEEEEAERHDFISSRRRTRKKKVERNQLANEVAKYGELDSVMETARVAAAEFPYAGITRS